MIKKLIPILFLFWCFVSFAQQSPQYSQYSFNNFGHNPAFAGTSKCGDFKAGTRLQWVGFEGAPRTSFASYYRTLGKKYFANRGKHAVGIYVEQDRIHLTTRTYIKLAYAYHKKLAKKLTLGLGIFAGIQQYATSSVFNNNGDPVLAAAGGSKLRYPDLMPGVLLYNNKFYASFSINQLYFKNIQLGKNEKQVNEYYFGMGHKSDYGNWTVFKSFLIKENILGPPSIDLNLAWVYYQNLTFGIGYRVGEAVIAQIKFKLFNTLTVTYAFDFPLNKIYGNYGHEVMVGFSKCSSGGIGEGSGVEPHVCPAYN